MGTKKRNQNHKHKNMFGGINIDPRFNPTTAFDYFMKNMKSVEVKSFSSIGCVGIIVEFDSTTLVSPYSHTRVSHIGQPINKLFMKLMLYDSLQDEFPDQYPKGTVREELIPNLRHSGKRSQFEISTKMSVMEEVSNQVEIYEKTFSDLTQSPGDPLCPALVFFSINTPESIIKELFVDKLWIDGDPENPTNKMKNEIIPPRAKVTDNVYPENKSVLLNNLLSRNKVNNYPVSFIAMEYLDGFEPLSKFDIYNNPSAEAKTLVGFCLYEAIRLRETCGFLHTDLHTNNIFVDPNYAYLDPFGNSQIYKGRAIIIDFGRLHRIDPQELSLIQNNYTLMQKIKSVRANETFAKHLPVDKYNNTSLTILISMIKQERSNIANIIIGMYDRVMGDAYINYFEHVQNKIYEESLETVNMDLNTTSTTTPSPNPSPISSSETASIISMDPIQTPGSKSNSGINMTSFGGAAAMIDRTQSALVPYNKENHVTKVIGNKAIENKVIDKKKREAIFNYYFPDKTKYNFYKSCIQHETDLIGKPITFYSYNPSSSSVQNPSQEKGGKKSKKKKTRKRKTMKRRRTTRKRKGGEFREGDNPNFRETRL